MPDPKCHTEFIPERDPAERRCRARRRSIFCSQLRENPWPPGLSHDYLRRVICLRARWQSSRVDNVARSRSIAPPPPPEPLFPPPEGGGVTGGVTGVTGVAGMGGSGGGSVSVTGIEL